MRWALARSSVQPSVLDRFRETFRSRVTRDGDVILVSQRYRDQARNREDCIEKLRNLVLSVAGEPRKRRATRPSHASRRRRRKDKERKSQKKKLRKSPPRDD
jgi:ribosome-associated protein